ncbi:MAG: leucine--tRNA ligase, partial [Pseudomonadales bacterium]
EARGRWDAQESFRASEDPSRETFYCLGMFPYPSGELHMGHVRCYTLTDVIGRYQRLLGKNVMQPMGWDAFGLPAENAAIERGVAPAEWTRQNIDHMRAQLKRLGLGIDWSREFATCDPGYYHWEQWMFTRLFRKGLAYRKNAIVNWDPVDQTVLANEQVEQGRGWRSGALVERREMPQWFLKITDYAEQLLECLDELPGWPEKVKTMQRNWIGRSEGVVIRFGVKGRDQHLDVFTTRPDTLLGATYVAIAPEHPLANELAPRNKALGEFVEQCKRVRAAEAELATVEKLGMETELRALHPITGAELPIWIANFVLMEYGAGAVMSVPAHDQRDWEFARKYSIPIVQVIEPGAPQPGADSNPDIACDIGTAAYVEYGRLLNSGEFSGLTSAQAFDAIADWLSERGRGGRQRQYRLRDWGVSRQRYWGCPIPIIYCDACGTVPVPDEDLPVILPTDVAFQGVHSPLTTMDSFLKVDCPECGGKARRETDTFDTFVESAWYYARFACPDSNKPMVDDRVNFWTPVDHYTGGIEHAILHLLYARFFHKLMRDEGLVRSDEPFKGLLMLGMVLKDGAKMSKSEGNVVDPQPLLDRYGADALRLAMMFAAPPDQTVEWSDSQVEGMSRYLRRLWTLVMSHAGGDEVEAIDVDALDDAQRGLRRKTHQTIARARDDYGRRIHFNT